MAERSRSYFVALGAALEHAVDIGTVKAILAHGLDFLISGRLSFSANGEAWEEKLRPFRDSVCQADEDEDAETRFLALYMPPRGTWPSSLLAIVACDWWSEFTTKDKEELFYPFFIEPTVVASVTSLVAYLSALGPSLSGSKSARVQLAGAEVGLEMLQRILTDESLNKLSEVVDTVLGNAAESGAYRLMEDFGGTLVKLPDMLAGAVAGAEKKWSSLAPGSIVKTIASTLLREFHERCCNCGEGKNSRRVQTEAGDLGVRFVCGMFDKMVRRGHVTEVADVILERSMVERGGSIESFAVRVFLELGTKAKVFERMVNWMCWPKLWRDDAAIEVLSRLVGPETISIIRIDGDEGKLSKQGKEIHHILTAECFVKSTFAFPVIHWLIEVLAGHGRKALMEATRQVLVSWSDGECVRILGIPQQAYITTACVGLLERLHANGVDVLEDNNLTGMIMEGVSTRLNSPSEVINCQAMRVATVVKRAKTGVQSLVDGIDDSFLELRNEEMWLGAELRFSETSNTEGSQTGLPLAGSDGGDDAGYEQGDTVVEVDSDDDSGYESSQDDDLKPLDLSEGGDGMPMVGDRPATLRDMIVGLRNTREPKQVVSALKNTPLLLESNPGELESMASDIGKALVYAPVPDWADEEGEGKDERGGRWGLPGMEKYRFSCMVSLLSVCPVVGGRAIIGELYSTKLTIMDRIGIMDALGEAGKRLANGGANASLEGPVAGGGNDHATSRIEPIGENDASTSSGKSRIWGVRSLEKRKRGPQRVFRNQFIDVAVPWAIGLLEECDKVRHGVDLFGRDHMLLARLLVTLGTFAQCTSQTSVSAEMALLTLELISSPGIQNHPEPVIRKSALSAAFQVLSGLPPARVAAATLGVGRGDAGDKMLAERLEWLRGWASGVASSDHDGTCRLLASGCVHLQAEVASKAMEFLDNSDGDLIGLSRGSIHYQMTW
ncbi:hypothetical protein BSKO_01057 [Bryopsis sp. KO-2023]|nr:hypothetical protein BSKO_01057 [Bryopsis sp. KO-2023]